MKVIEIFGPTVQGEGPHAGRVCHFLRFGGCDYRCSWCDTMYAVDPAQVRAADNLDVPDIMDTLHGLPPAPMVVLSGGNPALQKLDALMDELLWTYQIVAVETQGSLWRPWLRRVDSLVVSPKPPSSGMVSERNWQRFQVFMREADTHEGLALKIVAFDDEDLTWARTVHRAYPTAPLYLSAGTDVDTDDPLPGLSARYRWLCETVARDPAFHQARVLPQLHVVAWGARVGV